MPSGKICRRVKYDFSLDFLEFPSLKFRNEIFAERLEIFCSILGMILKKYPADQFFYAEVQYTKYEDPVFAAYTFFGVHMPLSCQQRKARLLSVMQYNILIITTQADRNINLLRKELTKTLTVS